MLELDGNPLLTQSGLAAYVSYLCTISQVKCIAVHPSFIANFYCKEVRSHNVEMQASDFILNPRAHSFSTVSVVFIPVLLHDLQPVPAAMLTTSVGHWVLGVYHTQKRKVIYFNPYGSQVDDIGQFQLRRTLTTLPPEIATQHFSIDSRKNIHFNVQSLDDGINCGYYVCLYIEMNILKNFQAFIK
uniref:Ubiquitin-like protease family profile domain-containing protein n=1 Tax=Romanomermis culicivorax TaxID=13658 RepID=A0A915JQA0_ROMCU